MYKLKLYKWLYEQLKHDNNNIITREQLFKTNNIVSYHIFKTLIIKYGIYTNIFAEKCE